MAVSPILLNTLPFDATLNHVLQFNYSGSQVYANRLIIKNNQTNTVVYDVKTSTMNLIATIPANTLANGNTYNFQISVFDHDDIESPLSNIVVLKCLATPTFNFTNIHQSDIIRNSFMDVELSYSQENGELLDEYEVVLYSANKTTMIFTSGTKYVGSGMTTKVSPLMDDTTYYLHATGKTLNGLEIETEYIEILCDYLNPDLFLSFRADNVADEGIVRLSSHFVLIEGNSNVESLTYIDGEKVDLTNGEQVYFDEGFTADNFVCQAIVSDVPDFTKFMTFDMKYTKVYLTWNYGYFDGSTEPLYFVELTASTYLGSQTLNYIQQSNKVVKPEECQQIFVWIKHDHGVFDVQIELLPMLIKEDEEIIEEVIEGGET